MDGVVNGVCVRCVGKINLFLIREKIRVSIMILENLERILFNGFFNKSIGKNVVIVVKILNIVVSVIFFILVCVFWIGFGVFCCFLNIFLLMIIVLFIRIFRMMIRLNVVMLFRE